MLGLKLKQKIILSVLVLIFTLSPFSHRGLNKAEAFLHDTGLIIKELARDGIAWAVINLLIENMTRETIDWINGRSGSGGPKYVQNLGGFLGDTADQVAGDFINNSPFGFVCDPFKFQLKIALARSRIPPIRAECTLSEVAENVQNFIEGDFYDGGWNAWGELVTTSNPYTQYLEAESELEARIRARQNIELAQLEWGGGFLSFQICEGGRYQCIKNQQIIPGLGGENDKNACEAQGGSHSCVAGASKIVTPGSVIEEQLNNVLASGHERLIVADEINEIIAAFLNKLINDVLSPDGLFGYDTSARPGTTPGTPNPNPTPIPPDVPPSCRLACEALYCNGSADPEDPEENICDLESLNLCLDACVSSIPPPTPGPNPNPGPGPNPNPNPIPGGGFGGDNPSPPPPSSFNDINWLHTDVSGWAETSSLTASDIDIDPGEICLDHSEAGNWPDIGGVEGNPWIFASIGGQWYGATYEWLRPGQVCKGIGSDPPFVTVRDTLGSHIKQSPMDNWAPRRGETVGFMVSGLARGSERNVDERTDIVFVTWPF